MQNTLIIGKSGHIIMPYSNEKLIGNFLILNIDRQKSSDQHKINLHNHLLICKFSTSTQLKQNKIQSLE